MSEDKKASHRLAAGALEAVWGEQVCPSILRWKREVFPCVAGGRVPVS